MEGKSIFRRWLKIIKGDFIIIFSLVIILTLCVFSVFPQYIARYDYHDVYLRKRFLTPSLEHPFGTDFVGRDIFSIIIWGSRIALTSMIWPTLISATLGVLFGILAGYVGGTPENIIMRIVDVLMSFPSFLLSLAILNVLGPGLTNAMWAVTIGRISGYVRLSRSLSLPIKDAGYVEYARALGTSKTRIMTRYILPNIIAPILVQMTFSLPGTLITIASLSFLGLGASPPTPDWGVLLQQSRKYLRYAPWAALIPGFIIFLVSFVHP